MSAESERTLKREERISRGLSGIRRTAASSGEVECPTERTRGFILAKVAMEMTVRQCSADHRGLGGSPYLAA